jgi:tRNA-splicing ligase RtcB
VVATDSVIVPAWVGYDIGCGMCAVPTTFKKSEVADKSAAIFAQIYKLVPVGFAHNQHPVTWNVQDVARTEFMQETFAAGGERQLGTLGGGNHFIEIGYDETDQVWIIIHSGSRNLGHKTATHYMKLASGDGKAREGHFGFLTWSESGSDYIADLNFCLRFALQNRLMILNRVVQSIQQYVTGADLPGGLINRNHNHAELKDGLWIHRKGATQAEAGMLGVIPGNMRDGSFIVEGKGNPDALWSSSHGAGRVMGRKEAQRSLDMGDFAFQMLGITAKVDAETLDESPFAYKDIFEVMRLQSGLVKILHHIKPIINIKGK